MRHPTRSLLAVSAAFIVMVSFYGCGRSKTNAQPEKKNNATREVKVSVQEIQPVPIRDVLILPGDTKARQDVLVPADKSGRVWVVGRRTDEGIVADERVLGHEIRHLMQWEDGRFRNPDE